MNYEPIVVSGVVLRNEAGQLLTVRKRGTERFMLPGGKWEPGEDGAAAALREVREEVGLELDPAGLELLGQFDAPAANEPGRRVDSTIFTHPSKERPQLAAEIAELRWQDVAGGELPSDLAPLLAQYVIPALRRADAQG
ncbi:MAG: NUDIX domain-containing protein [Buchananella hordeovulneris]|nr:NUDIX domain-containing protein [Buchananella hordeovulneris]